MIAGLLLVAAAQDTFSVQEVPAFGESLVVMQAWVKAPPLPSDEAAAWLMLPDILPAGTTTYTAARIQTFGSPAGIAPTIVSYPDMVRIQVVADPGNWQGAARVFASLIFEPSIRQDAVSAARERLSVRRSDPVMSAMDTRVLDPDSVSEELARYVWFKHMRPENVEIVVYGAVEPNTVGPFIQRELRQWAPPDQTTVRRGVEPAAQMKTQPGSVSTFLLRCKPITASSRFSSARLLATIALGTGKDSTLWRVHRDKLAMTYWAESVLFPTVSGWEPRFVMLRGSEESELRTLAGFIGSMLTDVDTWTEQTLLRAKVVAGQSLRSGVWPTPFWLTPQGPMGAGIDVEASWRGYLNLTKSASIGPDKWADMIDVVDLETLKAQAKQMLLEGEESLIHGEG